MSHYLLDHPNVSGPFYATKRPLTLAVVIHTAESIPDVIPVDGGAETVAYYASITRRSVSWHTVVDSDSTVHMLPHDYQAIHVRNYNDRTLGLEFATQASRWNGLPEWWVDGALEQAAREVAIWCVEYDIPPVFITKDDLDAGRKGITSHAQLDPSRRTDPGKDFPWTRFLGRVAYIVGVIMNWQKPGDKVDTKDDAFAVLYWQGDINPAALPENVLLPFAHVMNRMMELHLDVLELKR